MAELADARDLKSLDRKVVRVQSPLWAPKQNERVTIQIHTRLPFKISPFTLVVAIANANRRGFFFFPPSFLSPPPSAPQPLRTRRHVFLHTLWAGSAYFPWEGGGASRASGGHPGSLSISAFVGLLSGLLGVGGAVIIMPLLNVFFDRLGFSVDTTQHLSLGTSLATILFTSLSSVLAHRRYGSVRADIWKKMAPGIIAGTLGGALLAPHLPGLFLRGFFAFFVMLVGVHLLFNSTPRPKTGRLERAMLPVSILIGLISSLAGIAGTMLCVIFLVWAAIDWADAVGTSAALSLPISLTGTLGYAIAGWNFPELPPYSVGFVYLPGMFCLLVSSMSMAVVGARLAHSPRLPMQALRRCFAVGNILLGLSILRSVLFR